MLGALPVNLVIFSPSSDAFQGYSVFATLPILGALPARTSFGTAKRLHRLPHAKGRSEVRPIIGRKQAAASAAPAAADIGDLPSRDRRGRARRWGAIPVGVSLCFLLVAASAAQAGPD